MIFQGAKKIAFREGDSYTHLKNERLRGIEYSISMVLDTKKSVFGSQKWSRFHIWFIMALYYKMRQLFYYKIRQEFIKNASGTATKLLFFNPFLPNVPF